MAVKIRLRRMGAKKAPFYRIVVADSRAKANGDYIELLGQYEPFKGVVNLKEDKILHWLKNGAQPTDTVKSFLSKQKIWSKFMTEKNSKK